ncbi:uridylate-specific endoribonuclease B-like [Daphnia pulex]|uniref:uridylate-specific endoribonuclease B-like n=1 Tax=Daphnia pulex TaxID=6669 RepID=UPI001EE134E7|nr:uridylate-specific endoribonuclease B-like [Daphnia pulex]
MKLIAAVLFLALFGVSSSNAKSIRATPITDEELLALSKNLHINDVNGAVVELDLQAKTTIGDLSDKAPTRLITSDLTDVFTKPTYAAAQGLLNNYARNYSVQEEFTPEQLAEEIAFIDLVMETSVMQLLHEFLVSKGFFTEDVQEFKQFLWNKWFARWSKYVPDVVASGGWEHTNLGEKGSDGILYGFHSWIHVYNEEQYGHLNYLGYIDVIKTKSTTVMSMPILLNGNHVSSKPYTNLNVGASPELELALGTLCYIARDGVDALCVFQTSDAIEYAMDVHSVDYNGSNYIESSHTSFGEESNGRSVL